MTAESGRPVPPADLPAGAVCALTPDGRLSDGDIGEIERFRALLADKTTIMAEYADTLGPITPTHTYAALHPIPAQHDHDPELVRLWHERAGRLRELYRAYDSDTNLTQETQ